MNTDIRPPVPGPAAPSWQGHPSASVPSIDFLRWTPPAPGEPPDAKQRQHDLECAREVQVLVNFSLLADPFAMSGPAWCGRLILLVDRGGWRGGVERHAPESVNARAGAVDVALGSSSFRWVDGRYEVQASLGDITVDLTLEPLTDPCLFTNQRLARGRQLSWAVVPRLRATGTVQVGAERIELRGAPAYHDHNWGRFRWGDDFTWTWASILPWEADNPWCASVMRLCDRGRGTVRTQALFLWRGRTLVRAWRDHELELELEGIFPGRRSPAVPAVLSMLVDGPSDVPARIHLRAGRGADAVEVNFSVAGLSRLLMPDEVHPDSVTVLNEASGVVSMVGTVDGEPVHLEGPGVFELIR